MPPTRLQEMPPENGLLSLPLHVLIRVLLDSQDIGKANSRFSYRKPHPLPIRLSHTSSQLRQIVLGIPQIWANLDGRVLRSSNLLDLFLERSRNHGLAIKLDEAPSRTTIHKIVVHVNRWHSLEIGLESLEEFREIITPFHDLSVPNLKHLEIHLGDEEFSDETFSAAIFSGGTPSLRFLEISGAACFPSSLDALTTLKLHVVPGSPSLMSYAQFRNQLQAMPSLAQLVLIGEVTQWPPMEAVKDIKLPCLRSLKINPIEDYDANPWIPKHCVSSACATIPTSMLENFSLDVMTDKIRASFLRFVRNKTICFPHVKSLKWYTPLSVERDIITLFTAFPALEDLTLIEFQCDDIIKAMVKRDGNSSTKGAFWPHLHSLGVHSVTMGVLRDFVAARVASGAITKVKMHEGMLRTKRKEAEDVAWLQKHAKVEFVPLHVLRGH